MGIECVKINKASDFNKLRRMGHGKQINIFICNNINFEGKEFEPIDMSDNELFIIGCNNTISDLNIKSEELCTGLFSKVKSICVKNLNIFGANVKGTSVVGSLAGEVSENANVRDCKFLGNVSGESHCGGIFGVCKNLIINDCEVYCIVRGIDILGGICGMVDNAKLAENISLSYSVGKGKAVASDFGYLSSVENLRIEAMAKEAMEHLPVDYSEEEAMKLERIIKK